MSSWYWRVVALKATFVLACFVSYLNADDVIQKLPFCNQDPTSNPNLNNDLVIVSTLDGRLTAFSTDGGSKAWDVQTEPLLSSNLHHVELTSGGKWVRLVPSLSGALYRLSGDTLEPLPLHAEHLLSSSFKYTDDLVIAGARETLWIGLDAASGHIIYQCGSRGCINDQNTANAGRDLLVLRHDANTIRALDPRSGQEKWNFSVAEHQLSLSESAGCARGSTEADVSELSYAVVMPDGVVGVHKPDQPGNILWQHQLEAPVAAMWRLKSGSLHAIDVILAATRSLPHESSIELTPPSLYIGLHNQQMYVQESQLYIDRLDTAVSVRPLPWKPKTARPLLTGPNSETAIMKTEAEIGSLALMTLYGKIMNNKNHGYFLYGEDTSNCEKGTNVSEEDLLEADDPGVPKLLPDPDSEHHHVHVHVYSLWFWWKEVLLIAISSALLMNLMIWPRFFAPRFRPQSPLPLNQEYIVVERHYERPALPPPPPTYSGRYDCDFTPLRCLGRGGFGVVFEAKNNIDHCSYAVKRITLPRREQKRERVLREVRALAKLEHEHIVRYFNAWVEEPPPLWQEERDAAWTRELDGVSLAMTEEHTSAKPQIATSTQGTEPRPSRKGSIKLDMTKPLDPCIDALDYEKELELPSKRLRSLSCNDSFSIVFDENEKTKDISSISKLSKESLKKALNLTSDSFHSKDISKNLSLAKNLASGDNDDSFIVFANSQDLNHNSKGITVSDDKSRMCLDKVKNCENMKAKSQKEFNKKGHRRHWSLDLCVKSKSEDVKPERDRKMYLYIQMQLCLRDSLHDWLRHNRSFEARRDKAVSLFSQIVSAVEYVHLAGLIHRDLKPSNIFFAPDGRVKVGDFGLVTTMGDSSDGCEGPQHLDPQARHTYRVGTHLYMSPEQLAGKPYSYKVDVYSLGLVLFELLQPFNTEAERVACLLRLRSLQFPKHFTSKYPQEMEVLKLMLNEDPSERPTASGVRARAPLYQATDEKYHFALPSLAVTS